jgi:hypothetical protein
MVVHRAHPLNCETSIPALIGGMVMPNPRFYVRNHFQIPKIDPSSWRLNAVGLVERPMSLSMRDLVKMPSQAPVRHFRVRWKGPLPAEPACEWGAMELRSR